MHFLKQVQVPPNLISFSSELPSDFVAERKWSLRPDEDLWCAWKFFGRGSKTFEAIKFEDEIVQISVGYHVVALSSKGQVWSWGRNDYGEIPSTEKFLKNPIKVTLPISVKLISAGAYCTAALSSKQL